jgi:hypothetical protein
VAGHLRCACLSIRRDVILFGGGIIHESRTHRAFRCSVDEAFREQVL